MIKNKKHKSNLTTMSQEFIVILNQVDTDAPEMFIQKNEFTTTDPIEANRSSDGRYALSGFSFDGEGLLPLRKTEIYFGNANETLTNKWVRLETNNPDIPAQEISIYTDDSGAPTDGILKYQTLKIVVNP